MFQQPSAGSDFRAKDHIGHLLLIYVRELRENIATQYGTSDAISCDIVVLTDPNGPRRETGVLLFQKPLIASLRNSIGGDPVLARLGQGTAKPGQSAPYILNPYTSEDAAYATQWLQSVGGNPFQTAPAVQQPAPAAPLPQTPAVPAAPAPAAAPAAPAVPAPAAAPAAPTAPAATSPEAAAAAAALGMQVPPPAPAAQ